MFVELSQLRTVLPPSPFDALRDFDVNGTTGALALRERIFGPAQVATAALISSYNWLKQHGPPFVFLRHDPIDSSPEKLDFLQRSLPVIRDRMLVDSVAMLKSVSLRFVPAPRIDGLSRAEISARRAAFDYSPRIVLATSTHEHLSKDHLRRMAEHLGFSNKSILHGSEVNPDDEGWSAELCLQLIPGIVGPFFPAHCMPNLTAAFYFESPEIRRGSRHACEIAVSACDSLVVPTWTLPDLLRAYERQCGIEMYRIFVEEDHDPRELA